MTQETRTPTNVGKIVFWLLSLALVGGILLTLTVSEMMVRFVRREDRVALERVAREAAVFKAQSADADRSLYIEENGSFRIGSRPFDGNAEALVAYYKDMNDLEAYHGQTQTIVIHSNMQRSAVTESVVAMFKDAGLPIQVTTEGTP